MMQPVTAGVRQMGTKPPGVKVTIYPKKKRPPRTQDTPPGMTPSNSSRIVQFTGDIDEDTYPKLSTNDFDQYYPWVRWMHADFPTEPPPPKYRLLLSRTKRPCQDIFTDL